MSDSEKPVRRAGNRKPPLTVHPISVSGEFRAKETRVEQEARLAMEKAGAEHTHARETRKAAFEEWRDRLILKAGRSILGVVGVYCLLLNALPGTTTEQRNWATSTLTRIVGGLVGYIVGTAKK